MVGVGFSSGLAGWVRKKIAKSEAIQIIMILIIIITKRGVLCEEASFMM